jgi:hypothetical protein
MRTLALLTAFSPILGLTTLVLAQAPVSMVQILSDPNSVVQRKAPISTVGYLVWPGETILFLTDDHAQALDFSSSIDIIDDTDDGALQALPCFDRYVSVTGTPIFLEGGRVALTDIQSIRWTGGVSGGTSCYPAPSD